MQDLAAKIRTERDTRRPYIVGITGQDASGKSMLAAELTEHLKTEPSNDVILVHVDDFHRPRAQRYDPTLSESDAYLHRSFHFDQLESTILAPLRRNERLDAHVSHLDLVSDTYTNNRHYMAGPDSIVILEGVLLLQPELRRYFDLTVFVHADRETILDRAFTRNVPLEGHDVMRKYDVKYLPAQKQHLQDYPPQSAVDIVVDNSVWATPTALPFADGTETLFQRRTPEAIIFDLWETLIPLPATMKRRAFFATADALGEDHRLLRTAWAATRRRRETVELSQYLSELAEELDRPWSPAAIEGAMLARRRIHGEAVANAAPSIAVLLNRLRDHGARLGLISNCSSDMRSTLETNGLARCFDSITLSAEIGCMKPEPRIYAKAISNLQVTNPADAVYAGDGSDAELVGAYRAGLHPIRLNRQDATSWPGTTSTTLTQLVTDFEKAARPQ
ncbi:HAD-IA family hydrolase [Microbacterium testaceum]|uniref:HAD-IA family hydrolase n=1 Tax=Microbacterium testaceum TaxID=2033 RepID=UPI002ACBE282|nr:HAD-IA family hydrolase [Microbacterium testaceum]